MGNLLDDQKSGLDRLVGNLRFAERAMEAALDAGLVAGETVELGGHSVGAGQRLLEFFAVRSGVFAGSPSSSVGGEKRRA